MREVEEGPFLDLLYQAAVDPELWEPAMERFADMTGGTSAWLSRLSVVNGAGSGVIARIDPAMPALYQQYYGALNPFSVADDPATYMRAWTPKVMTEDECLDPAELWRCEYYNDFMRPQDLHSVMIVRLCAVGHVTSALTVNRPEARGRFEREHVAVARRLHPHLRRAYDLTLMVADTGFMREEVGVALDQASHGVFILDHLGQLRRMNRNAETMLARRLGLRVSQGRLRANTPTADRRLELLIGQATGSDPTGCRAGDMVLTVDDKRSPLFLTVAPVSTERFAVFGHRPFVIVCVRDPDADVGVSPDYLRQMFGFTAAETRVARAILCGATTRQAAEALGISFHTVRHQLQSMLEKAGVTRQADLMALLTRVGGLPNRPPTTGA